MSGAEDGCMTGEASGTVLDPESPAGGGRVGELIRTLDAALRPAPAARGPRRAADALD